MRKLKIEVRTDLDEDGEEERVLITDHAYGDDANSVVYVSFKNSNNIATVNYPGYWGSYMVTGDLSENGRADIVVNMITMNLVTIFVLLMLCSCAQKGETMESTPEINDSGAMQSTPVPEDNVEPSISQEVLKRKEEIINMFCLILEFPYFATVDSFDNHMLVLIMLQ